MKKILLFLLLLLNLQLTIDSGFVSIRLGVVSAQSLLSETLDEVVVRGKKDYVTCDWCHCGMISDLSYHKKHMCPERMKHCYNCNTDYYRGDPHNCPSIGGSGGGSGSGGGGGSGSGGGGGSGLGGGGGSGSGGGGGSGSGGGGGSSKSHKDARVDHNTLIVQNKLTCLPQEFYKQPKGDKDCVIITIATELARQRIKKNKKLDFNTVFYEEYNRLMSMLPEDIRGNLKKRNGISQAEIDSYFVSKDNPSRQILEKLDNSWFDNISNLIANDYGVIACSKCDELHEILIVAADPNTKTLYAAAWNDVGNVNAIQWIDISNYNMYIIKK